MVIYKKSRTDLENIAMAGGTFANVRLNQKIKEIKDVQNVFIFPHMADGGLSVGAAAMAEPKMKVQRLHDVYFGPEFTEAEAKRRDWVRITRKRRDIPKVWCESEVKRLHSKKVKAEVVSVKKKASEYKGKTYYVTYHSVWRDKNYSSK